MQSRQFQTVSDDVVGIEVSFVLSFADAERLRAEFFKFVPPTTIKVILDVRGVRPWNNDAVGAVLKGSKLFRRDHGGTMHLVVEEHQRKILRQMHLDNPDGLGLCFATREEAERAFGSNPPRLAIVS